jgi:hypothetical protein
MHAMKVTKKIFNFYEREREKLDRWNPWAMESSSDNLRDYVLKRIGACRRYNLVQLLLQA